MKTEKTTDLSSFDNMVLSQDELMLLKGGQTTTASVDCGWGCGVGCGGNCGDNCGGCPPTEGPTDKPDDGPTLIPV